MAESGKVVIITGASSGIGEATARILAKKGMRVMLAARREERLKTLTEQLAAEGADVEYRVVDVTQLVEVQKLATATIDRFGRIDVLVNNAGVMPVSPMIEGKIDEWEQMVDVNIKGVLWGIHAVLAHMVGRESGHIINVSSVAGHQVFPAFAVYCGTKFAVRAISEGLRQETAGKVRVTNISPGAVATELVDHITDDNVKAGLDPLMQMAIEPEAIGRAIAFAIEEPENVSVNEMIIRPSGQEH